MSVKTRVRTHDLHATMETTIDNVHVHDIILGKREGERFLVTGKARKRMVVNLTLQPIVGGAYVPEYVTHTFEVSHLVTLQREHPCHCAGTGVFYGHGRVENGVFIGHKGVCYGCHGKGWQDRSDVIRNQTYWDKYARI